MSNYYFSMPMALCERTCRSRDSVVCNSSSRTAIPGQERIQSTCFVRPLPGHCECMLKSCKDIKELFRYLKKKRNKKDLIHDSEGYGTRSKMTPPYSNAILFKHKV